MLINQKANNNSVGKIVAIDGGAGIIKDVVVEEITLLGGKKVKQFTIKVINTEDGTTKTYKTMGGREG